MSLYCTKCRVWAYRNHKCSTSGLIPIKPGCQGVVNTLCDIGMEPMSAAWYADAVPDTLEYSINIEIEFRHLYHPCLLSELPAGWHWQESTVSDSKNKYSTLVYEETFIWWGMESAEQRIKQILDELEHYIVTIDKPAFNAMLTLTAV